MLSLVTGNIEVESESESFVTIYEERGVVLELNLS